MTAPRTAAPSSSVAEYYRRHHEGGTGFRRYGFTVGEEERSRWFSHRIGSGVDLLDLGCRDGSMTRHFLSGNRIVGLDVDATAAQMARDGLGIDARTADLNAPPLPLDDSTFDVAIAGEILEHLMFPDNVVAEVHRVLRPGGRFLGSVPNAFRLPNRIRFLLGHDFEIDPTHLHHFSPDSLRSLLRAFHEVEIDFLCGRHRWLSKRFLSTIMVWSARK